MVEKELRGSREHTERMLKIELTPELKRHILRYLLGKLATLSPHASGERTHGTLPE
jgi:hypothetical protein